MEVYRAIVEWAEHTHVPVVFGTDHLVERLIDLAPHTRVLYPPTSEETAKEVALVMLNQSQGEMRRWWGANDGAGSFSKYG